MFLYPDNFIGTMHPYIKLQVFKDGKMIFETPSWPNVSDNEEYLMSLCDAFIQRNYMSDHQLIIQREEHQQKHVYTRVE